MVLLSEVIQDKRGLIGITESGEEIPVVEKKQGNVWRNEDGTSLYGLFQIDLQRDYKSEVERSLEKANGYYIIGDAIRNNGRTTINYIEYQKT